MIKKLLYIALFMCATTVFSQQQSYRQAVLNYLEVNGTTQQYQQAVEQLFELLQQQFKDQDVPEAVWTELKKEGQPALQQIKAMLVSAYRGTFDGQEINDMLQFYGTAAGKQLTHDQTAMTENQKQEMANFFNTPTGQKILSSQQEISEKVGEVSEIWSRELYIRMIDKLAEQGFILQQ